MGCQWEIAGNRGSLFRCQGTVTCKAGQVRQQLGSPNKSRHRQYAISPWDRKAHDAQQTVDQQPDYGRGSTGSLSKGENAENALVRATQRFTAAKTGGLSLSFHIA